MYLALVLLGFLHGLVFLPVRSLLSPVDIGFYENLGLACMPDPVILFPRGRIILYTVH